MVQRIKAGILLPDTKAIRIKKFLDEHPNEAFFLKELEQQGVIHWLNGYTITTLKKLGYTVKLGKIRIYATPERIEDIKKAAEAEMIKWEN